MSRLVDPTVCPDCRAPLTPSGVCTGCGLALTGPLAVQLWEAMSVADRLVERLRAAQAAAAEPVVPTLAPGVPSSTPAPVAPLPAVESRRPMSGASVRTILLAVGGICLLVAAIVFTAVTWSLLGLTGRTLVLLGVTAAVAVASAVVTRRGLRGATETLWLLVAALVTIDLLAAAAAGFPGLSDLAWRTMSLLVGGALLGVGVLPAWWARSQPVGRLHGPQLAAGTGALVVVASNGWAAEHPAVGAFVAIPVLVGLFRLSRGALPLLGWSFASLAAVSWCVLLGHGLEGLTVHPSGWYTDLAGWPLVAAAAVAAVAATVRVDQLLRTLAAGAALACGAGFALGPVSAPTTELLQVCGVVLVLAAVSATAPALWARAAGTLAALGLVGLGAALLLQPSRLLTTFSTTVGDLPSRVVPAPVDRPAGWTWLLVATTVLAVAAGLLRHLPQPGAARGQLLALAPTVVGLGVATTTVASSTPLWVVTVAFLAVLVGAAVTMVALQDQPLAAGVAAGLLLVAGFDAALTGFGSTLLAAVVATTVAAVLTALAVLLRPSTLGAVAAPASAAGAVLAAGAAVALWGAHAGVSEAWISWSLAALVAALLLGALLLDPEDLRRQAAEGALLPVAVVAFLGADSTATASVTVTVIGSALALAGIVAERRDGYRWLGAAVLLVAAMLRAAAGQVAPELATLPAALVLVAAGAHRLLRDPETDSIRALAPGLALGLLPSLLPALAEPRTLRGVLVAAAALGLVAVGASRRWSAPLVAGAAVTTLLAVRHLAPLMDAVPRWISLGTVGVVLLVAGITWESRMNNVATAGRYLRRLR